MDRLASAFSPRPWTSAGTDDEPSSSASPSSDAVAPRMMPATAASMTSSSARASARLAVLAVLQGPSRAPLVFSRAKQLDRLDAMLEHLRREAAGKPAATRLLPLRLHMLNGLYQVAVKAVQSAAPSEADLVNADQAILLSHRMQLALRCLLQMPESQLAPLADEERRLAKKQEGLLMRGLISREANGRSRDHAYRAFDVHTAATAERLADALSAFDRFIDELCPVPTAADNEAGGPEAACDAPEVYDPFGVLPYAQDSNAKRP